MDRSGIPGLSDKLQHLFKSIPQPDGRGPYTNEALAGQCSARGVALTPSHVNKLRNGLSDNPSAKLLGAIADVFGVPVDYFFDPNTTARVDAEIASLRKLRQVAGLRHAGDLDMDAVAQLLAIIDTVHPPESGAPPHA